MNDELDSLTAPPPPRSYWKALEAIARHHEIHIQLLHGSQDQTQAPDEELFFLRLARALLLLAAHGDEWTSTRAIAAISAIDVGTIKGQQEREISENGPLIAKKRAYDLLWGAAQRTVDVAQVIVRKSGISKRGRGRPPELSANGERIYKLMIEAEVSFSEPWPTGWTKLKAHIEKEPRPTLDGKGKKSKSALNALVGPKGVRAREVYRTIKKRWAKTDELLTKLFSD